MLKSSLRFFVILLAALLLSACKFTLAADVTPPPGYQPEADLLATPEATTGPQYPLLPPNPVEGKIIYNEKCAPCHGESGMGDGPQAAQLPNPVAALGSPDLARQDSPAKWFNIVTEGNLERFMPPFSSLTDRQRWDVVSYILSLSLPEGSLSQGKELYQANCTQCHAPDGTPAKAGASDFTSQEDMVGKSTQDLYQAITDGNGESMPGYASSLPEDQRWLLAYYLRSFTFAVHPGAALGPAAAATLAASQPLTNTQTLTPTAQISATASLGVVSGLIVNGSSGAVPAGLMVTLHAFDGMQVVMTSTTTTSDDGAYLFSDVEMTPERQFLTTVEFQDITYGSDVAAAEAGQLLLDLPIQVYESTRDASILTVDRLHFFFEMADTNILRVVELYVISNPTSKTLIGAAQGDPVVSFTLPADASNIEFQDGEVGVRYKLTDGGFADTMPVRPGIGNYQVMFAYELPYKGKVDLVRPASMLTNAVVILVPEDGIKIKGANIEDGGVRDVQGMSYHLYNGSSVQAGQEIRLTISNNLQLLPSGSNANLLVGLGALGLVLIGAGVWLFRRNRPASTDDLDEEGDEEPPAAAETSESVMDAILALDDLHQAGQLPEDAYIQRRNELRSRLKELMGKQ